MLTILYWVCILIMHGETLVCFSLVSLSNNVYGACLHCIISCLLFAM